MFSRSCDVFSAAAFGSNIPPARPYIDDYIGRRNVAPAILKKGPFPLKGFHIWPHLCPNIGFPVSFQQMLIGADAARYDTKKYVSCREGGQNRLLCDSGAAIKFWMSMLGISQVSI